MLEILKQIIDLFLNIDKHLETIIQMFGMWSYILLFLIIFIETGLVIVPFLPGDSLIFAAGAFTAAGSFKMCFMYPILVLAAILGDTVNYWIGELLGKKLLEKNKIPLIKKEHVEKTEKFFAKHGGKTIILARFVPIVRTFAPFVAGIGKMSYFKFLSYNVIGGFLWVTLFLWLGYLFGNIPFVQNNFEFVIVAIILISALPMFREYLKEKNSKREIVEESEAEE
ncbi:DedA family protein [Candidatus Beckwithbacteria bacterium]|nr:DedA family protein [Candidatus Beckwithbacteria bacterium]